MSMTRVRCTHVRRVEEAELRWPATHLGWPEQLSWKKCLSRGPGRWAGTCMAGGEQRESRQGDTLQSWMGGRSGNSREGWGVWSSYMQQCPNMLLWPWGMPLASLLDLWVSVCLSFQRSWENFHCFCTERRNIRNTKSWVCKCKLCAASGPRNSWKSVWISCGFYEDDMRSCAWIRPLVETQHKSVIGVLS